MRRYQALILSAVLGISVFSGCSQKASNNEASATATTQLKKDVTLSFSSHQSGLPSSGIVQELGKDFEKQTGIKIDFQVIPDAQWRDLLKAKLSSGEASDVFCADADPFSLYDRVRPDINCIDLSGEEYVKRMDPTIIPSVSYKNKVYGVSYSGYKIYYYFYNKKIFNDLGIQPPKNYKEFKDISQKIKNSGVTPIYEALQNGWHQVLPLFETGPNYAKLYPGLYDKLNNNETNIKDIKELETVITQVKEFADLGFYGKDYMSNSVAGDMKAFADGKAAMVLQSTGWEQRLAKDFPQTQGNVGFFAMPWADNQTVGVNPSGNAYFGNVKSKYKNEILELFRFLSKAENVQKRFDGDPGAVTICWPEVKQKLPKEYVDYQKSHENGVVMQVGVKYIDSQFMDTGKDLEAMYAGAMTPKQVVENIAKRRDEQAKLQKDAAWNK